MKVSFIFFLFLLIGVIRLLRIGASALPENQREKYFMSVTEAEVLFFN